MNQRTSQSSPTLHTGRRSSKLVSLVGSCFTSHYVMSWPALMGAARPLQAAPMFDARAVLYPSEAMVRDYLAWRQVDTHINNQVGAGTAAPTPSR